MCKTIVTRGPCWCNGNNGRIVNVREKLDECENVKSGGSHDEYWQPHMNMDIVGGGECNECRGLAFEAERLEIEAREAQKLEAEIRKEVIKKVIKEAIKEAIKEVIKEVIKEAIKDVIQEDTKEAIKEAIREATKKPIEKVIQEDIEDTIAD
ncbi:hypothetical protein ACHAPG_000970 [Botrytis cinerea]